jgi:hypothetical protein
MIVKSWTAEEHVGKEKPVLGGGRAKKEKNYNLGQRKSK